METKFLIQAVFILATWHSALFKILYCPTKSGYLLLFLEMTEQMKVSHAYTSGILPKINLFKHILWLYFYCILGSTYIIQD